MAEIATIARPYAEALFRSVDDGRAAAVADEVQALANVAMNEQLRQFADSPKVTAAQVFEMMTSIVSQRTELGAPSRNLLQAVIDNGRLGALPEISAQFQSLLNVRSGVSHATIYSAFAIDDGRLADVVSALERRFGRKLTATVEIQPDLIGGLRAVVGDEVFDTSVKARLEQMKAALTA